MIRQLWHGVYGRWYARILHIFSGTMVSRKVFSSNGLRLKTSELRYAGYASGWG
jgi:hypothetical protein